MENTEIPAEKTAAEISSCLIAAGATQISTRYQESKIVGLMWTMRIGTGELNFAMPARVEPLYEILKNRRSRIGTFLSTETTARLRAQAERVAWRQLLRWVQAQLAMIDVNMAQRHEVFMPYIQRSDGKTFFEYFESTQLKLPAAEAKSV
jgi:hypothetical protein